MTETFENMQEYMNQLPCGIGIFQIGNFKAEFLNDAYFDMIGYTREEYAKFENQVVPFLMHPEDVEEQRTDAERFNDDKKPFGRKYRIIRKNGKVAWIQMNTSVINIQDKEKAIASFIDITREVDASARLDFVSKNIKSSISMFKIDRGKLEYEFANDYFYELVGTTKKYFIEHTSEIIEKCISKQDEKKVAKAVSDALEIGKTVTVEHQLTKLSGEKRWVRRRISVKSHDEKYCYTYISILDDITEEKTAKIKEELESERFQMVVNELEAAVFEWNIIDGSFYQSQGTLKYNFFLNTPEENLFNPESIKYVFSDDREVAKDFFEKLRAGKYRAEAEVRLETMDGSFHWCRMVGRIKKNQDDETECVIGTIIDIDREVRQAEEQRKLLNHIATGIGMYEVVNGEAFEKYMNDGFYRLVSDTRENRMKQAKGVFLKLVHPEDKENIYACVNMLINGQDNGSFTCRTLTGKGNYIWLRVVATVVKREKNYLQVYVCYSDMKDEMAAREDLERNKELLNSAIQSIDMLVWEFDVKTKNLKIVSGDMDNHGLSSNIVKNMPEGPIKDGLIHEDSIDDYRRFFADFISMKQTVTGNHFVRTSKEEDYWWERNTITPVFDDKGNLIRGVGITINITERKELEMQFEAQINAMESIDMYNMIAKSRSNISQNKTLFYEAKSENALNISVFTSYDNSIEMLGLSAASDEEQRRIHEVFDRKNIITNYKLNITEGKIRFRRWSRKNVIIWCEARYVLTEDPKNHEYILFMYSYDVTDSVMEEQLINKISEVEYDAIGVIDAWTDHYQFVNYRGLECEGGWKEEGNYEKDFVNLIHRNVVSADIERCLKELDLSSVRNELRNKPTYTVTYSKKDGKRILRKKFQFAYLDEFKRTIMFTRSDVTELYQQEMEQLNRTQEALIEAEMAGREKADFFARMSHDMRTPMNGILGMTELSKDTDDPAELHHNMEMIETSGRYLINLINDILDLQRIESGKLTLKNSLIRCDTFIENITDMMKPTAGRKKVVFVVDNKNVNLDQYARLDTVRYQQIFINIMSNAVKFTPEGGKVQFLMETLSRESGIDHDRFTITDTGIGMSEDFLRHKLFNPYSQENNAMTTKYTGSGLGLAITKNLVDLMGGTIEVSSEQGVGTKVVLTIDVNVVDNETAEEELERKNDFQTMAVGVLRGKRILVCEDNELNAEIAKKLLERVDCEVALAGNGAQGVEVVRKSDDGYFDAVLMDIRMPVMDGLEAARHIRSLDRVDAKKIPIIAMTANAFNEDRKNSFEAGMNAHLAKPINPKEVYRTLMELIK